MDTLPGLEDTHDDRMASVRHLIQDTEAKLRNARKMKDARVVAILEGEQRRLYQIAREVHRDSQGTQGTLI